VVSRDPLSDGKFVYCVRTTGIYCRPVCKARLARRANVEFHNNAADALAAGFRACKRCKPELDAFEPHSAAVAKARRAIEEADSKSRPTLKALAAEAELSEWHFHRIFKQATGVTPKAYAKGARKTQATLATSTNPSTPQLTVSRGSPISELDFGQYSSTLFSDDAHSYALQPFDVEMPSDENFAELLELPWKSTEVPSDSVVAFEDNSSRLFQLGKEIQYTIQPWESVFVLIASTEDGICALDTGLSEANHLATLQSLFPFSPIHLSDWDGVWDAAESSNSVHRSFATVMQALVNPSGKVLHLPFDVGLSG
jgi:methylphosphotriester-DNA--protein-cysteine methyltransferase